MGKSRRRSRWRTGCARKPASASASSTACLLRLSPRSSAGTWLQTLTGRWPGGNPTDCGLTIRTILASALSCFDFGVGVPASAGCFRLKPGLQPQFLAVTDYFCYLSTLFPTQFLPWEPGFLLKNNPVSKAETGLPEYLVGQTIHATHKPMSTRAKYNRCLSPRS